MSNFMTSSELIAAMREALDIAESVMSYCQGDAWERECTRDERNRFAFLKAKIDEDQTH